MTAVFPPVAGFRCDRAVVVGDIHGERALLERLLTRADDDRQLVVVGDLCDRGPDTRGVLDLLIGRRAVGVRGNHDEVMLRALEGHLDPTWLHPHMGGRETLASYGVPDDELLSGEIDLSRVPRAHRAFLASLPVVLDLDVAGDRYYIAHAGLPTNVSLRGVPYERIVEHLAEHHRDAILWAKNDVEAALPVGRPVISGHMGRDEALISEDAIAIDVRGALTALLLPERELVAVPRG